MSSVKPSAAANHAKPKKVGVTEIAKAAGISPAAVSSLLRSPDGKGRVSAKTRDIILRACRELGYEPTHSSAFNRVYPELGDYCFALSSEAAGGFQNPYYSLALKGLTDALPTDHSHVHFCRFQVGEDYLADPGALPPPIRNGVATKILCAGHPNLSFVEALRERRLSVVYLGQEIPLSSVTCLVPDFAAGATAVVRHLVELGHERIALAAGPLSDGSYNILKQRQAFERAMIEAGLAVRSEWIFFGPLNPEGGISAVQSLLSTSQPPTALYCLNDATAIGAIQEAHRQGVRVPEQLSVVGFDDIWLSQSCSPPLTTVHSPVEEMARRAVEEMDRLNGEAPKAGAPPHTIILPTHLVVRESSSAPGKACTPR